MSSAPPPAHDPARTAEALFSRSWAVFRKNWNVAIPPLIAGAIGLITVVPLTLVAALVVILGYKHSGTTAPFDVRLIGASLAIVAVVNILVSWWSFAATYGMADAAWTRGTASFADGWNAFRARGGAILVSWVAVALLAIAAVIVALPTLGLSVIVLPLVTMYVAPSVVVGGRGGFAAVGESFRLVRRSLGRSSLILLMQFAISYGIGTIASFGIVPMELAMVPLAPDQQLHAPPTGYIVLAALAYLVTIILSLVLSGFVAVLLVGFYRTLLAEAAETAQTTA